VTCWYHETRRRPPIYWGPRDCTGPATHAERLADGAQRVYCDGHARWRGSDIPSAPIREMRSGEAPGRELDDANPRGTDLTT
jgi:hypothetical protein